MGKIFKISWDYFCTLNLTFHIFEICTSVLLHNSKTRWKFKAFSQIIFFFGQILLQILHGYAKWKTLLPKNIKIPRVYSKCNMRYVRDTDYWNIDRVIRCFTISEITRMYPHSWKNCMQVGDIMQNLIIASNIFWSNIVANKQFAVGRSELVEGWWKTPPSKEKTKPWWGTGEKSPTTLRITSFY